MEEGTGILIIYFVYFVFVKFIVVVVVVDPGTVSDRAEPGYLYSHFPILQTVKLVKFICILIIVEVFL